MPRQVRSKCEATANMRTRKTRGQDRDSEVVARSLLQRPMPVWKKKIRGPAWSPAAAVRGALLVQEPKVCERSLPPT